MNLRRGVEFAFGVGVFLLGGCFLALALGHLSEPIASDRVARAAAPPRELQRRAERPVIARASVTRPHPSSTSGRVVASTQATDATSRSLQTTPALVASRPVPRPIIDVSVDPKTIVKRVARPHAAAATVKRAHALARASVRDDPRSNATPEPPIGYDEKPTMLQANGLEDPSPTPGPT